MFKIDALGKACPLPVIETHKALKEHDAVEITVDNKIATENLKKLASQGVSIYACGACLNYYQLTDKVAVGEITNMYRIVEIMRTADRIVRP